MYHIAVSVAKSDFTKVLALLKSYCGRSFRSQPGIIAGVFDDAQVAWCLKQDFPDVRIGISKYQGIAMGLSAIANTGEILVDQDTISPLMEIYEFSSLGLMNIEGMKAQLMVYRAEALMHPIDLKRWQPNEFPYIEREREVSLLKDALSECNLVQITGRDGIGKTCFLKRFAETSDRQFHLIPIWNYPPAIPFSPLDRLIKSLLGIKPQTQLGEAQEIINHRLKELNVRDFVSSYYSFLEFLKISEEETLIAKLNLPKRYELLKNSIVELIIEIHSRDKLLIIFDDLQFADGSSLEMLKQIFEEIANLDVKVIYSSEYPIDLGLKMHSIELGLLNPSTQHELIDLFGVEGVEPGPALPLQLKLYLSLVDAERNRALFQEFEGKSGIHSTPFKEIPWLINRWLDHLSDQAREFIINTAVIGSEFTESELKYLFPKAKFEEVIPELLANGLIELNDYYQFHHRYIREEIYNANQDRAKIHNRLSEYYKKRNDPIRTVFHLIHAEKIDQAIASYIDAAQAALERNAWRTAIDYYLEAKDLARRLIEKNKDVDVEIVVGIDERIGDIYRELGDEENALKFYKSVLDSYRDILKE